MATATLERVMDLLRTQPTQRWVFSTRGGLMLLSARAAYAAYNVSTPGVRMIMLSVYAKVTGAGVVTTRGAQVRQWEELMERILVPADTSREEQERAMVSLMGMVAARAGLDYKCLTPVSTRPALSSAQMQQSFSPEDYTRMLQGNMRADTGVRTNLRKMYGA